MQFAIVMSGGRGKRFWPLSRAGRAKQLVNLGGDKSLLELTVERLTPVFQPGEILVVTQARQLEATRRVLERFGAPDGAAADELPAAQGRPTGIGILSEPVGKNTAACIVYAATYVMATAGDAVLAVLPADHFVRDADAFRRVLLAGMEFARERDAIVTIGIRPDRPATGFGYIKRGSPAGEVEGLDFYEADTFTEKPELKLAQSYVESGEYFWNAGIFVFRASTILREIETHLPEMAAEFKRCERSLGTPDEQRCIADCYSRVEEISVDFGVMEKSGSVFVVPAEIGWDDVGSWVSYAKYMDKDSAGNAVRGRHVTIGSKDCIVYSDQLTVATIGLTGITIVASRDAVLVMKREKGEEVKDIVDLIEKQGLTDLL